MLSQSSNRKFGCSQFHSQFLPHFSRSSLKLSPLSASPTASSKAQLLILLMEDFERRAIDTRDFPPTIDIGHICHSITRYKTYVKSYFAIINNVCYYCGLFVWLLLLAVVLKSDLVIIAALKNQVINLTCLNHCDQEIDEYCFCFPCYQLIKQKKIPKFSSLNKVNVIICQDYPLVLETLTLIEEILIAQCHLVMSILKLHPNGALLSIAYQRIRGYAVVFPQLLGPLSIIPLLAVLKLHEHI